MTSDGLAKLTNPKLKRLNIYFSENIDALAEGLKRLTQLEELDIRASKLGGPTLSAIAKLPNLKKLDFYSAQTTEKDLALVAASPCLEHLVIGDCPNIRQEEIEQIKKKFPKLKVDFTPLQ